MKKICFLVIFLFFLTTYCFAEKITILYTGQTHAALYPCSCPKEPDGGVSRRMTKVKELRQVNPNTLLVDAGGFFAAGAFDEHAQGIELDKARNEINLEAMGLIGYDALGIGDDELNFTRDYLIRRVKESKIPFLSANLKIEGARPYIIKKLGAVQIALIGLTNTEAKAKSGGLDVEDAKKALAKIIQEVKKKNADLILLLSYLGEDKDKELLAKTEGIDVLISGRPENAPEAYTKIGQAILVRPSWQGRRLGKLELEVEQAKLKSFKVEQIRLSKEVIDSAEIGKILPQCFADSECRKDGLVGRCANPGKLEAACSWTAPQKIPLLVIQPKDTQPFTQERFVEFLNNTFPGLEPQFIDSQSELGESWVNKTQAKLIPVYLLAKEADTQAGFKNIKEFAELKEDYYYLSPRLAGGSVFVGRPKMAKRLDVFLGSRGKNIQGILALLKELQTLHKDLLVNIHYLAVEVKDGFSSPGGLPELEEDIRQVCISHYFPDKFWDYALCRSNMQESSWWDVCAQQFGINAEKVKKCSLSQEGLGLFKENTALSKELEISAGPVFLVNNYKVFAISGVPKKEEMEKILGLDSEVTKK